MLSGSAPRRVDITRPDRREQPLVLALGEQWLARAIGLGTPRRPSRCTELMPQEFHEASQMRVLGGGRNRVVKLIVRS